MSNGATGDAMNDLCLNIAPACSELGLTQQGSLRTSRTFKGAVEGRMVTVSCGRRSRSRYAGDVRLRVYDGHRLEILVESAVPTRLVLGDERRGGVLADSINKKLGAERVEGLAPSLQHLAVWASEPDWIRRAVADLEVSNLLLYLLPIQGPQANAKVTMGPDMLSFHLKTTGFTPTEVDYWLESVLRLVKALEGAPAPTKVEQLNRVEKMGRKNPYQMVGLLFGAVIFAGFIFIAVLVGLAVLATTLS